MRSPFGSEPIALVLAEPTARRLRSALSGARRSRAALVELRLDALKDSRELIRFLRSLLEEPPRTSAIATLRRREAGGAFTGTIASQLILLRVALEAGCRWVDLEMESAERVSRATIEALLGWERLILSYHNFRATPRRLGSVVRRLENFRPFCAKLATQARTHGDVLRLLRLAKGGRRRILVPMGDASAWGRILALRAGSALAYARPEKSSGTAPGQATLAEMRELFRAHRITPRTRIYGVIGRPVAHSLSPAMQNAALAARRLDAVYLPVEVVDLRDFLRTVRVLGVSGFSVTLPHKEAILEYLDGCDPLAARIGAVNTVVVRGRGHLYGYNTDYVGVLRPLARRMELGGKRVLIVGAGGAARAVAFALGTAGSEVFITARRPERARSLARAAGAVALERRALCHLEFDAIVNATPVGMEPATNASPLEPAELRARLVFDMVYRPRLTRLLQLARRRGLGTIPGWEMLLEQGAAQFEIWTGLRAPLPAMRRALLRALQRAERLGAADHPR